MKDTREYMVGVARSVPFYSQGANPKNRRIKIEKPQSEEILVGFANKIEAGRAKVPVGTLRCVKVIGKSAATRKAKSMLVAARKEGIL
jgi:hypothetical protein